MQSLGLNVIYHSLALVKFVDFIALPESGFCGENETKIYKYIAEYIRQYNRLPTLDLVQSKFDIEKPTEPFDYCRDEFINRHIFNLYQQEINTINKFIADRNIKEATARLNEFTNKIVTLKAKTSSVTTMQNIAGDILVGLRDLKFSVGMTGVPTGWKTLDETSCGLQAGDVYVFSGRPKTGKGLRNGTPVLTPKGWVAVELLKVGDLVYSQNGRAVKVTGVYPQKIQDVYRVKTIDKGSVVVDGSHLWLVKHRSQDTFNKIKTTQNLIDYFKHCSKHDKIYIPLAKVCHFPVRKITIEPYLMGVMLCDSYLSKRVLREQKSRDKEDILLHLRTEFTFENYLWNTVKIRKDVLAGLMDNNGFVSESGNTMGFDTCSKQLAEDISFLVQSLGGKVKSIRSKEFSESNINGESETDQLGYRVIFQTDFNPFKLWGKANRFRKNKIENGARQIRSITKLKKAKTTCITVAHPSQLFITEDFIVTHNSNLILYMASDAYQKGFTPLLVSMEMTSKQYARRFCGLRTGVNSKLYKSGEVSYWGEQKLKQEIDNLPTHPYYYVEGQFKRNISEILAITSELKPDILFIDGAYLVKVAESGKYVKTNKWEKITEVAEGIKNIAITCNIPVVVSFQFNREVGRKDKSAGFEDIQLADAIGQLASVVIGIFDENEEGTVKRLDIIGGRDGESGYWLIDWNWDTMSFKEITC